VLSHIKKGKVVLSGVVACLVGRWGEAAIASDCMERSEKAFLSSFFLLE
jgi:alkylated DNA nucleotide flippase Atl1